MIKIAGHIKNVGKGRWRVTVESGTDPATGRRKRIVRHVQGRQGDAQALLLKLQVELQEGTYIQQDKMTLAEYLGYWLQAYCVPNLGPATLPSYTRIINSHVVPALGHIKLTDLKPLHIQGYYAAKLTSGRRDGKPGGLSARSVRYHHTVLREALQHAVKWQLLKVNPADATEPPRPVKPGFRALGMAEVRDLLDKLRGHRDEHLSAVALFTGMRQGELLALQWGSVDLEKKVVRVVQTVRWVNGEGFVFTPKAKSNRGMREIPLPAIAVEALRRQKVMVAQERLAGGEAYIQNDLVFPTRKGRPTDASSLARSWKKKMPGMGYRGLRFHDLRHTHASTLLAMGVHPKIVQERLGHETVSVTLDTYSHVLPGLQEDTVNKLDQFVEGTFRHKSGT